MPASNNSFQHVIGVAGTIGECRTCVNYEPKIRHCALLDMWFEDDGAEQEGECPSYQPDPHQN